MKWLGRETNVRGGCENVESGTKEEPNRPWRVCGKTTMRPLHWTLRIIGWRLNYQSSLGQCENNCLTRLAQELVNKRVYEFALGCRFIFSWDLVKITHECFWNNDVTLNKHAIGIRCIINLVLHEILKQFPGRNPCPWSWLFSEPPPYCNQNVSSSHTTCSIYYIVYHSSLYRIICLELIKMNLIGGQTRRFLML